MRKLLTLLLLIIFFIYPSFVFADVVERVLPNGLKVLLVEDHKSPLAVFQIWYRVGSRNEVSGTSGISHLLEHMMFKGTKKHGSKELSRTVQRYGGSDNAFTSKDYTTYFQILPSDKIGLSIDFESDRMTQLLMNEKDALSERDVVMEERRMRYEDDPQNALYEEAVAAAFKVHPYRFPVIGWMSDLSDIDRYELFKHYRQYYSPSDSFIVVVGDIRTEEMFKKISAAFSKKKAGPAVKSPVSAEPPQKGERRVYLRREAELPFIVALYHIPKYGDDDSYALDVLSSILSSGKSSRLYKSLIYEKKLAISAFADYSGAMKDPFLFELGATASPGTNINDLEAALEAEIEAIKQTPPSEMEVQKAKNQLEADFVMDQDSIFYQALLIGRMEIIGDWRLKDVYVERIRKVTPENVQRAARKYFGKDNRTVGILEPLKKESETGGE